MWSGGQPEHGSLYLIDTAQHYKLNRFCSGYRIGLVVVVVVVVDNYYN